MFAEEKLSKTVKCAAEKIRELANIPFAMPYLEDRRENNKPLKNNSSPIGDSRCLKILPKKTWNSGRLK
jgi:hypothetical protein